MGKEGRFTETSGQNKRSTYYDQRIGCQRGKNYTGRDERGGQEEQISVLEREEEVIKSAGDCLLVNLYGFTIMSGQRTHFTYLQLVSFSVPLAL